MSRQSFDQWMLLLSPSPSRSGQNRQNNNRITTCDIHVSIDNSRLVLFTSDSGSYEKGHTKTMANDSDNAQYTFKRETESETMNKIVIAISYCLQHNFFLQLLIFFSLLLLGYCWCCRYHHLTIFIRFFFLQANVLFSIWWLTIRKWNCMYQQGSWTLRRIYIIAIVKWVRYANAIYC